MTSTGLLALSGPPPLQVFWLFLLTFAGLMLRHERWARDYLHTLSDGQ